MSYNKGNFVTDIIDKIVSVDWLYEKVFGKLLDKIIYNKDIKNDIGILKNVFQMDNADKIFELPVDNKEFKEITAIIFKYQNQYQQQQKGLFSFGSKNNE